MEVKKLKQAKFKYEIDGVVYNVRRPSFDEVTKYDESYEKNKDSAKKIFQGLLNFIGKLGVPEKILRSLPIDDLNTIMEDVTGKKI